jgi:hypothetical protein
MEQEGGGLPWRPVVMHGVAAVAPPPPPPALVLVVGGGHCAPHCCARRWWWWWWWRAVAPWSSCTSLVGGPLRLLPSCPLVVVLVDGSGSGCWSIEKKENMRRKIKNKKLRGRTYHRGRSSCTALVGVPLRFRSYSLRDGTARLRSACPLSLKIGSATNG